jgi:hypothetical protein
MEIDMRIKATTENIGKHVFEVSECGIAPFRLVSLWQLPSPVMMNSIGGCEQYNAIMASAPCRVGCCAHCGMPLIYHYIIKDANGKLFAVGCECVNKTGDSGLIKEVARAKKSLEQKVRADKKAVKVQSAKAKRQAEIQVRIDTFRFANPGVVEFLEAENAKEDGQAIFTNFYHQLLTWGNISEKQVECVLNAIKKASEPVVTSNWVGTIGKRESFSNVKIEAIITVPCQSFNYNDRNSMEFYILKDSNGNNIIFKTKTFQQVNKGDVVNITASVKDHAEYKGQKQTVIQRCKFEVI